MGDMIHVERLLPVPSDRSHDFPYRAAAPPETATTATGR